MDRWWDYLLMGLRGVLRHKLRSILTVLGIVFAISALLSMLAVGEGARRQLVSDMEQMGLRNIIVTSQRPPKKATEKEDNSNDYHVPAFGLTTKDLTLCKAVLPTLQHTAAVHELRLPCALFGRKINAHALGVTEDYFKIFKVRLNSGQMLSALDASLLKNVCLIATPVPPEVTRAHDLLDAVLSIGGTPFRVVGTVTLLSKVLEPKSDGTGKEEEQKADSNVVTVYLPFESAVARFGLLTFSEDSGTYQRYKMELNKLILECDDPLLALNPLKAALAKGHPEADYEITVPVEVLRQRQRTQEVFNLVLLMVAGLTLLVGGIGIINIMLVSVAERTKEIGIRRALGAKRRDIMFQFLIETLALTMSGGLLGVLAGLAGVQAVQLYTGWPVSVTPSAVLQSFLVSMVAGVLFGLYPARQAASVMPVVALRYE